MAHNQGLIVGLDGGGSKTLALLADRAGAVLGRGVAGPSNYQAVGAVAAGAALAAAIAAAFSDANLPPIPLQALCLGLAGVDRSDDQAMVRAWAAQHAPGAALRIANDAELVLADGTPAGWGVALICGTGSIAYARRPDGRMARAGGWGYLIGDEGSGYAIGVSALQAVLRDHDGRGPRTALTPTVLAHWGLSSPNALVGQVYRSNLSRADIAALAALVDAAGANGDGVAQRILAAAADELALAARAAMQALQMAGSTPCALAGSVIVKGRLLRDLFSAASAGQGLALTPLNLVAEPALGALRLARQLLDADAAIVA